MASTFNLEILTPYRSFFKGEVEMLILPGSDGEYGILASHSPMVTAINPGKLRIKQNNEWKEASVSTGFIEVLPESSILLCDTCEWPHEIDANRAKIAKEKAEEVLRQNISQIEHIKAQAALRRALSRLKVVKKLN